MNYKQEGIVKRLIPISFTAVSMAFIGGMALVPHPAPVPFRTFKAMADTSTTQTMTTMTPVSAELSSWSDPVPGTNDGPNVPISAPTTFQSQYCVWTYGDGSTQKKYYRSKYITEYSTNTSATSADSPAYDCTIANAPAIN